MTGIDPADHSPWEPFLTDLARAADLCLRPHRHALRFQAEPPAGEADGGDCLLRIEVRDGEGRRLEAADLELEIYRSGATLNLMLTRLGDEEAPLLWHGQHPVWMDPATGLRCDRPEDGAPYEAFCRRVRALLPGGVGPQSPG